MEKELRRYFASVISNNLGIEVEPNRIHLDPYVLVFLLPTWTSKVTNDNKKRFIEGEDIFTIILSSSGQLVDFPELSKLDGEEREHVLNIYRCELYALHNIIEYYQTNMIDHSTPFQELFYNMLIDTCSTPSSIMEEYVKINDHGIVYYVPYEMLIDNLIKDININPFTEEPYSNLVYQNICKKYRIEIKMLTC